MSYCSFSGGEEFKNHFQAGIYVCSECGHELFSSMSKFEHSSPWPAFSETIHEDSVSKRLLWEVWQWIGPRVLVRRTDRGAVTLLNIQQLTHVHP
ncbi:methionine-R-sulfoxide reductase B1-A-like [Anarhichas minor]|uniref:methionine-R-sulfoxide reductase B1-A-like n=1 Tax=Anarhichas minor TaxID=65739 RepID=UPI003F73FA68